MFDAQMLINPSASGLTIYGPWMPRGGDNATLGIDLVAESMTAGGFRIRVATKASEDAGDGVAISTEKTIAHGDGADQYTWEVSGQMKDLVRYEFAFVNSANAGAWVLFRMLPISWFDSVATS